MSDTTKGPRKPLPVRIPGELLDRIDKIRDPDIPRERYIRRLLTQAVEVEERKNNPATLHLPGDRTRKRLTGGW
jgi:hypothetical protein